MSLAQSGFEETYPAKKPKRKGAFQTDDEKNDSMRNINKFDFSKVEFHSDDEEPPVDDNDLLGFLSEQTNKNIAELLGVIESQETYVQSGLRALQREISQSFDQMQREYFIGLIKSTLKRLIDIGRAYITKNTLNQAKKVLIACSEMFDAYLRKKFDLWELKADFGNTYAMLEARHENYKLSLHVLDETLEIQKKLGIGVGTTLLNKCKVYSLQNRHEEANAAARQALIRTKQGIDKLGYFDLEDQQCLDLVKTLVVCYYNIAVEESNLANPDVAVMNYEEAYKVAHEYFGEEDVLTQKMKFQWKQYQHQLMKIRKQEIHFDKEFAKTKFIIRDRRLAAEDSNPFRSGARVHVHPQKPVEPVEKKPFLRKRNFFRPSSAKPVQSATNSQSNIIVFRPPVDNLLSQKSALKHPEEFVSPNPKNVKFFDQKAKTTSTNLKPPHPDQYPDNSDAYQSDAPSKAIKGFKTQSQIQPPSNQINNEIQALEQLGILSWEQDINPALEELQKPSNGPLNLEAAVIIKEPWDQEGKESEYVIALQKKNRLTLLNQLKNVNIEEMSTTAQKRAKILQTQAKQINEKTATLTVKGVDEQKSAEFQIESEVIEIYGREQFEDQGEQSEAKTPKQEMATLPIQQLVQDDQKSVSNTPSQPDGSTRKINQVVSPARQLALAKRKRDPNAKPGETRQEYYERMRQEMEQYLMQNNPEQQHLDFRIKDNDEKEQIMVEINKKKKEQIYGALMGLEMLQERFNQQKRKLEEMQKHEQHQVKVIEVLHNKKLKYQDEYKAKVKRFHAANVIRRYLLFSRDRRSWDNYKLRKNKNLWILQEFRNVKLPQRIDLVKLTAKMQFQQRSLTQSGVMIGQPSGKATKQKVSEFAFGTLAIYVDLFTHQLQFKFYAPPESIELEKKRFPYYHQVSIYELEYYYGRYAESSLTREVVGNLLENMMSKKIIVDYNKVGLAIESQGFHRNELMEDKSGDLFQLQVGVLRDKETFTIIKAMDQVLQTFNSTSDESVPIEQVRQLDPKYYLIPTDGGVKRALVQKIFRDALNVNWIYKLSLIQLTTKVSEEESTHEYWGMLRFIGSIDNLWMPHLHFLMKSRIKNEGIIKEMQMKDYELPLYFEIDTEKKIFNSRPKALREEEIIKLQRHIRRFIAWRKLRAMVKAQYHTYLNMVVPYKDYKFWIKIYKHLYSQKCFVTIETLDLKVFMSEDQKRISGQFKVDEDAAKRLAKHRDPIIFFLINERNYTVKLMRLMIESLRDEDVRKLQRRLRVMVGKKRLQVIIKERFTMLSVKKITVRNRPLLLRIYMKHDIIRYVVDVCDLVRTRYRSNEHKGRYYADMIILKSYADLALDYKEQSRLFDFGFNERKIDYTKKIQKIQSIFRQKVYTKRNKVLAAYDQVVLFQRVFEFKQTKLLVQVIDRIIEGNKKVAYFCSLKNKRKDPTYLNSVVPIPSSMVDATKTEVRLQKLYDFNFPAKTVTLFEMNEAHIKKIQNFWLRKLTKVHFRAEYHKELCCLEYYENELILFYLYETLATETRTLYAESLSNKRKKDRLKVIRQPIIKSIIINRQFIKAIHPVHNAKLKLLLFDFEVRLINRLQTWGKMKYIIKQLKTQPKSYEFIYMKKVNLPACPYIFGIYTIKEVSHFIVFLVALRPRNRKSGEKQYFLNQRISYLLFEEMYHLSDPCARYVKYDNGVASLTNIHETLKPSYVKHLGKDVEVKVHLDKQIQKITFTAENIIQGDYYLHTFDETFIDQLSNNLYLYVFPLSRKKALYKLGALYMPEVKHVFTIQQHFRQHYYRERKVHNISNQIKGEVMVAKKQWINWSTVLSTPFQHRLNNGDINAVFPPILLNESQFDSKSQSLKLQLWREPIYSLFHTERCVGSSNLKYPDLGTQTEVTLQKQMVSTKIQGFLRIANVENIQRYMFIDYLRSGIKFNVSIAIDFSSSNGLDNKNKLSLHYLDPRKKNSYERGIMMLSPLLQHCPQQAARIYGFSAVPNQEISNDTSQSFPLSYDVNNHVVEGLQAILTSYHKANSLVRPSSPPGFSQLLQNAKSLAIDLRWEHTFLTLVILSATQNGDFEEAANIVESMDGLPISIFVIATGKQTKNQFVVDCNQSGKHNVHFYNLQATESIEQQMMLDIRTDFLNYARQADLAPPEPQSLQESEQM